jgi:hypothetical protein
MKIININQGDDRWHIERHRSVTGTRFQSAVGAKYSKAKGWTVGNEAIQETLMLEMISENRSILEIDDYQNAAMLRGHELEPLSIAAASKELKKEFKTAGMLQSDTMPLFKFSPDAVYFNKDNVITGGFETKSKAGKAHIEYIVADELPKEHFFQCLCPMVMDKDVQWWAFGHYDDRDMVNPLFLTGIKREDYTDLIAECEVLIADFIKELHKRTIELGGYYEEKLILGVN